MPVIRIADQGIGAFVNGGMTISNIRIRKADGAYLTAPFELTAGTQFRVVVDVNAKNNAGGSVFDWSICLTVIDATKVVKNYTTRNSAGELGSSIIAGNVPIDSMGYNVMPANDITLTIKGWGTDNHNLLTPPPENLWTATG